MNALPQHLQADYHGWESPVDDHGEAVRRAGERIENDADQVRELVENAFGIDDPCCDADWSRDLLIALRELRPVFAGLCHGDTLEIATKTPDQAQHFRALLRCAETADTWIANLINEKAVEDVDATEECE